MSTRLLELTHFEAYLMKRALTCLLQSAEIEAKLLEKLNTVPLINPNLTPLTIKELIAKLEDLYEGLS